MEHEEQGHLAAPSGDVPSAYENQTSRPVATLTNAELAKVIARADKAAAEWMRETDSNVESRVVKMLDSRLVEIVAKLLGFDNRWGQWELDHCNGRGGESAAGQWLISRADKAVHEWLEKQAGNLPDLPKSVGANLRKQYLSDFEHAAHRALRERAEQDAQQYVNSIAPKRT